MTPMYKANYLSVRPIEQAMRRFAQQFSLEQRVLDIGCGKMPYRPLFQAEYVGLDPLASVSPDVVGDAWDLPFDDNSFDGIILNQSLEHIAKTEATVREIERVLKPRGRAIITVPQTMRNHSVAEPAHKSPYQNFNHKHHPYWQVDYYRFTKFGLIYLFQNFTIVSLKETTGYFGTLCQLLNYFFASLGLRRLGSPIYFLLNCLGLSADYLFGAVRSNNRGVAHKFHHFTYTSLTTTLILIVEKPAQQRHNSALQPLQSSTR